MVGKLTRNDQLSASRLPTLMNASPYNTRNDLLAEFIAIDGGKEPSSLAQNDAMLFGDLTENIILSEAAKRLGCEDLQLDFDHAFQHATLPLGASLDATAVGSRRWAADPAIGIYTPQGIDMVDLTPTRCASSRCWRKSGTRAMAISPPVRTSSTTGPS